jgi:4-hydroxy-tetrahydrodipicolinate synthase
LLAPVSYTALTDDEVFEHFAAVARDSGLPICIYDNPGTTHFRFTPKLVGRLSRVEGIIAVKTSAPDRSAVAGHVNELRAATSSDFFLGYSADWNCVEALLAGGTTWYSVLPEKVPGNRPRRAAWRCRRGATARRGIAADLEPLQGVFEYPGRLRHRQSEGTLHG